MKRWILATAALGAMVLPALSQELGAAAKSDAEKRDVEKREGDIKEAQRRTALDVAGAPGKPVQVLVREQPGVAGQGGVASVQFVPAAPGGKHEKVTYLGVVTSSAAPAMREQLKLAKGVGLLVDSVEPKTAAEAAGVKQHDVIEKLNDQFLINTEQFTALLRSMKPGDEVTLSIIRQGERQSLKAKLGEKEIDNGGVFNVMLDPAGLPPGVPAPPIAGGRGQQDIFILRDANGVNAMTRGAPPGAGVPTRIGGRVMVRNVDGKQTTDWSDNEFFIKVEREGDKVSSVTVTDVKTGKVIFTGTPPEADNPIFKTLPQLADKLKHAQEAAARPMAGNVLWAAADPTMGGARGKVKKWQDGDHLMFMRVMGDKPLYLLALSKKDGRTLYDGPVMTDEQRQSIPAEVREQFDLLVSHPDDAKEFGAADAKAKK